tara:strand:- start:4551 stop:4994 length:444 start_codon:yes stop_codon:yes gene_type:complete
MSKSVRHHTRRQRKVILSTLNETIEQCAGPEETKNLIDKLLTESEKLTLGRRLLISRLILEGKSQAEVNEILHVSPNTFTRTRKWLQQEIPAYGEAIKEYEKDLATRKAVQKSKDYSDPFTFDGLRKKYPGHFLLFNLAEEFLSKKK